MGALRVTGRFFILEDPEKLLYSWASLRKLGADVLYKTNVNLPVLEIEGQIPPGAVFACYSAFKFRLKTVPADYDKVYVYTHDLEEIKNRFPKNKGRENLIVLKADPFLKTYGQTTTLSQTFVDIWNLPDWFAKEFVKSLKEKIDALLS